MSSDPATLRHLTPWMRAVDESLDGHGDTLAEHAMALAKQEAKLGSHDKSLGELCQELETLRNLMIAKVDSIDDTIRRIRLRLNGR